MQTNGFCFLKAKKVDRFCFIGHDFYMTNLRPEPAICPACGELIIADVGQLDVLMIPPHPDAVTPWTLCLAGARPLREAEVEWI